MSDSGQDNKVLGIETGVYTKLSYILILVASGLGLFSNLLALVGISMFGGMFFGLLGLIGIAMVVTGLAGFKEKFPALDISHFLFLLVLFAAFFVLGAIFAGTLINMGAIGAIILFLLSALQFTLLITGFKLWQGGQLATKENLISGVKNLTSTLKK